MRGGGSPLIALTPVAPGRAERLRDVLAHLPTGAASPIARLESTHFARWVVLPLELRRPQAGERAAACLLFTADFDGSQTAYLRALAARMPAEADAIWGNCSGYPGSADGRAFARWMRLHRVRAGFSIRAYRGARVDEIREALIVRARLAAFATRTQGVAAEELQQRWREEMR